MRWSSEAEPNLGDKRTIKKFLFLPRRIDNKLIWLKTIAIEQRFQRAYWGDDYWEDISYSLIKRIK